MNEEQVQFLRENAYGRSRSQLIELFKEKFGVVFTATQIAYYKSKHGIKSGYVNGSGARLLTEEQLEWIIGFLPAQEYSTLINLLKEKFGVEITKQQLSCLFRHKGIQSGVDTKFRKGYVPTNKGKRLTEEQKEKIRTTILSKHIISPKRLPVGSEYVRRDGFVNVKVANPNKWRMKQHVVWEMFHEPIKKNEMLVFLDGDRQNCRIENLMLITRAENTILNRKQMRSDDAGLTKAGVLLAKLHMLKKEKLNIRKEC